MMKVLMTLAAIAVSTSALAHQQEQASGPAAKPVSERKICRSTGETGSRLSKRICHTQSEWAQIEADDRASVQSMTREGGVNAYNRR